MMIDEGLGIYEAFKAEYNPPTIEVILPGKLISEVVLYDTEEVYDVQMIFWDWK